MTVETLNKEELELIKKDRSVRSMLARKSHFWFISIYLGHYINYPFAPFHHQMFRITEDPEPTTTALVAFRGSGKSTNMTLSYPIWAIVGAQHKKFVLILSQTQAQARLHLANIKRELETNELLKSDIGPFEEESDEWGSSTIVISNYDARISIASSEQSIRGLRHGQHRPDLVICDDVEDLSSVKFKENRDKTYVWLKGEVLTIGDSNTKKIIVGNLLHEDSLLMRLKSEMEHGTLGGKFFMYPIIDDDGVISWPSKFFDLNSINTLKKTIGSESAWSREYLLRIISEEDRLVRPEWIKYYDDLPSDNIEEPKFIGTGVDLAISTRESSDCTAMVTGRVYGYREELKVYILPNPVNKHMNFPTTVDMAKELCRTLHTKLFIEENGYQKALVEHLTVNNIPSEGVKTYAQDKRSRIALVTHLIQLGKVLFPRHGAEELISQLVNFGIEKHDDLADAFAILLLKVIDSDNVPEPQLIVVDLVSNFYDRFNPTKWVSNSERDW